MIKDLFNRPFFKDNKRAITWMCVIIFLLILVVAYLNSQDKAVAPPPTPVPPTVNVADSGDELGKCPDCCSACKKCKDKDWWDPDRGAFCAQCAQCSVNDCAHDCDKTEYKVGQLAAERALTPRLKEVGGEWHWPGCSIPPCPPPLQDARVFKQIELNSYLGEYPNLCTCALLCPAKCTQ